MKSSMGKNFRFSELSLIFCLFLGSVFSISCSQRILSSIQREDQSELMYFFEPIADEFGPALQIDVIFRGNPNGKTIIRIPTRWQNVSGLERSLRKLHALTPGVRIGSLTSDGTREVEHESSEILHLRYVFSQDSETKLRYAEQEFLPRIEPSYFFFVGGTVLITPDVSPSKPLHISLRWFSLKSNQTIINSLAPVEKVQVVDSHLENLKNAVYLGGDYRLNSDDAGSSRPKVVLRGQWAFSDSEFFKMIENLTQEAASLWDVKPLGFWALTPIAKNCCRYDGILLDQGWAGLIAMDTSMTSDFIRLYAQKIFETMLEPKNKDASSTANWIWMRTGVSRFASRRAVLKQGIWNFDQYLSDLNLDLRDYWSSDYKRWPAERILRIARENRGASRQFSFRGDLLLQNWAAQIRRKGISSGDFNLALRLATQEGQWSRMNSVLGADAVQQWDKVIRLGGEVEISPDAAGSCARLEWVKIKTFEIGFDFETSKEEGRIVQVQSGSQAERAGLRVGQKLLAWRVRLGDAAYTAEFRIRSGKKESVIRYLPVSNKTVLVPQFIHQPGSSFSGDACLHGLGL